MRSPAVNPFRGLGVRINRGLAIFLIALTIVVIGSVLRIHKLDSQSLWTDEVLTIRVYEQRWFSLMEYQLHDPSPPLYYIFMGVWAPELDTDFMVRLPAALFGILLLPFVYFFGREMFGRRSGLLALALFAVWPLHVYYSQENRYQSMFALLVMLSSLAHIRFILSGRLSSWIIYVAASIMAVYTHYYAPFVLLGQSIAALAFNRGRRLWLAQGLALVAIGVAFLPQVPAFLYQIRISQAREGFELFQRVLILLGFIVYGGSEWSMATLPFLRLPVEHANYLWAAVALGAPLLAAIVLGLLRDIRHPRHRGYLVLTVLVPIVMVLAISSYKPLFRPKYFLQWMPFFAVLAAGGLTWLWPRARVLTAAMACLIIVTLTGSVMLIHDDPHYRREDWRNSTARLIQRLEMGRDCVVVLNKYSNVALMYYYESSVPVVPILGEFTRPVALPRAAVEYRFSELARKYDRMWVVWFQENIWDPEGTVRSVVQEHYPEIEVSDLARDPRYEIKLYSLRPDRADAEVSNCVDFLTDNFSEYQLLYGWQEELANQRWMGRSGAVTLGHVRREPFVQAIFYVYVPYFEGVIPEACLTVEGRAVNCVTIEDTANYWIYGVVPDEFMDNDTLTVGLECSSGFIPQEILGDGGMQEKSAIVQKLCLVDNEYKIIDEQSIDEPVLDERTIGEGEVMDQ